MTSIIAVILWSVMGLFVFVALVATDCSLTVSKMLSNWKIWILSIICGPASLLVMAFLYLGSLIGAIFSHLNDAFEYRFKKFKNWLKTP